MKLPAENAPMAEIMERDIDILPNTARFDCAHHPVIKSPLWHRRRSPHRYTQMTPDSQ